MVNNMKNAFAERFRSLRKERNLTQEQLAAEFGVTVQAVSKWETAASYPDIEIIAEIAKFFDVSIDYLLGKEERQPVNESAEENGTAESVDESRADETQRVIVRSFGLDSIQDDEVLRVILCRGRQVLDSKEYENMEIPLVINADSGRYGSRCRIEVYGNAKISDNVQGDVITYGNLYCGKIRGDLLAGGSIECDGTINGDAKAGGNVNCHDVAGDVKSGGSINCGRVDGDISAGGNVNCGDVDGDAKAGGTVACGDVNGDVTTKNDLTCGNVGGDVSAVGKVGCKTIAGDANTAFSSINCGSVCGDVKAGTSITCGNVAGDVNAGSWVNCEDVDGDINAGGNVTAGRVDGSVTAGSGRNFTAGTKHSSNGRSGGKNTKDSSGMSNFDIGDYINRAVEEAMGKIDFGEKFGKHFDRKFAEEFDSEDEDLDLNEEDFDFTPEESEDEE